MLIKIHGNRMGKDELTCSGVLDNEDEAAGD